MDVFELTAKLGLDTSEYDKGLGNAANTGQTFGSKVGGVFKGAGKAIAAGIAAGAVAVTAFAKQSVDAGMAFDSAMSNVQAISGATGDDMMLLRDKAIEMGSQTKFTAQDSADAFSYMAMAGWKTGDMLDGISGIMSLAAASGEDLATTSDIVTDALTAFGLEAKDSGHFADVLAAASSNANTNVSMMGETFKYAAPIAGALGFSAEDTAEAIGLMANAGIKGSQAGTSLRTIMNSLTGEVKIAGKELGEVSIATTNTDGTMRDLSDIVDDCRDAFSHLSESEKAQAAETLVGKNAMSGFLALMNASPKDVNKLRSALKNCTYDIDGINKKLKSSGVEWSKYADKAWMASENGLENLTNQIIYSLTEVGATAEELQDYLVMEYEMDPSDAMAAIELVQGELENSVGAAQKMSDIMMDNLSGDIELFKSAVGTANIALSDVLTPSLRDFVKFGTDGVSQITAAFQEGGLSGAMTALGDVIAQGLTLVLQYIPKVIDAGAQIFSALVNGILQNLPLIVDAAGQIGNSLIDSIQNNLTTNFPALGEAFNGLLETAQTAFNGIITIIQDVFAGDWSAAWNDMLTLVGDVFNGLGGWFLERFNAAKDAITSIDWATVGSTVWNFIKDGIGNVTDWFNENFEAAKKAISEDVNWGEAGSAIEAAFNLAETAASAFSDAVTTVLGWLEQVFDTSDSATNFGETSSSAWGLITTAIETVTEAIETVSGWFTDIFNSSSNATAFGDVVKSAWNLIETAIKNVNTALTSAKTFFENVFQKAEPASTFGSAIEAAFGLVSTAIDAISTAINTVLGWFEDLFNNQSLAESYGTAIQSVWDMVTTAIDGVSTAIDSVIGFFEKVFQKKQPAQTFGKALEKAFGLISDAADAISHAIEAVIGWFEDVFSNQETAEAYGSALESVWNLVTTAIDLVSTAISHVIEWFASLFDNESSANNFGNVLQAAFGLVSTAADLISTAIEAAIGWLDDLFGQDGPAQKFASAINKVFDGVAGAISKISDAASSAVDWLKKLFGYDGKTINVNYNIHKTESGTTHGGGGTKFATAMTGGRILSSGAEIFGYDNGKPLIGGEAGPEAIVGTGSLDRMIQASVNIAMNRVLDRLDNIIGAMNSGNTQIVLDTGALVGGIAEEMDAELNRIASWKEGGRA